MASGLQRSTGVRWGDRLHCAVDPLIAEGASVAQKSMDPRRERSAPPSWWLAWHWIQSVGKGNAHQDGTRRTHMKRFVVGIIAAAFLVSTAQTAMAQAKTVWSEMRTETGTVEAIDAATRTVTLKKAGRHLRDDRRRARHQALRGAQGRRQGHRSVLRERRRPAEAARRAGRRERARRPRPLPSRSCRVARKPSR